ncbi:MAG: rod shape-determining protein MreD [Candidatus Latescibacteria bacterium]|jgi:rod shape-determining protein MreD|nr:rod shape-determining protein MreD [Candidatus Latescibacterota bacterium]
MNAIIQLLWLICAVVVQWAWGSAISFGGVTPYLPLIPIARLALNDGEVSGTSAGFVSGLAMDLFVLDRFGVRALVGAILGYLLGGSRDRLAGDALQTRLVLVAAAVALHETAVAVLAGAWSVGTVPSAVASGVYTGILAAILWGIAVVFDGLSGRSSS